MKKNKLYPDFWRKSDNSKISKNQSPSSRSGKDGLQIFKISSKSQMKNRNSGAIAMRLRNMEEKSNVRSREYSDNGLSPPQIVEQNRSNLQQKINVSMDAGKETPEQNQRLWRDHA